MVETSVCMNQEIEHKHLQASDLPAIVQVAKFYGCCGMLKFLINYPSPQYFQWAG
jgi:hypothetical protein